MAIPIQVIREVYSISILPAKIGSGKNTGIYCMCYDQNTENVDLLKQQWWICDSLENIYRKTWKNKIAYLLRRIKKSLRKLIFLIKSSNYKMIDKIQNGKRWEKENDFVIFKLLYYGQLGIKMNELWIIQPFYTHF